MKIFKFTLENMCGMKSGVIYANGANVYIGGQNGTGKSTYVNAYSLLMTGKYYDGTTGEVNELDANGDYIRDDKIHAIEMEIDDGEIFRREFVNQFDKQGNFKGVTQKFYVNGVPMKQKDFDAKIYQLTQGSPINLFGFCKMNWKDRRNILMSMIHINDAEILKNFPELKLGRLDAQSLIDANKSEMKKLEKEVATIPARIDELQKQIIDGDIEELQTKLSAKMEEVSRLQVDSQKVTQLKYFVQTQEMQVKNEQSHIAIAQESFKNLGEKFVKVKNSKVGTCPYCEQQMPLEKFKQSKNTQLNKLKKQGWQARAEIENHQKLLTQSQTELEKLQAELSQIEVPADNFEKLEKAIHERDALQYQISRLKVSEENKKRIEELKKCETKINADIAQLQKQIDLAEKFQRQKIKAIEESINAQFEVVKFKMFDVCINGSVKEICEPMINGVTYGNLSKGEQLKAALDVLKTMQKFYKVELPIWIDDAESYTSNSFVELPNQMFLLKAVEGQKELKIEVEEHTENFMKEKAA